MENSFDVAMLSALKRTELQALCKARGIKANSKTVSSTMQEQNRNRQHNKPAETQCHSRDQRIETDSARPYVSTLALPHRLLLPIRSLSSHVVVTISDAARQRS